MTDHVVRVLRAVAVAVFIVGSVSLSSKAADQAPPAAGSGPTPAGGTGAAGEPARAPATPQAAKSQCEGRVARLVGKGSAALRDPDVQALAKAMPNLAVCAAVVRDSDEPCDLLPADQAKSCRKARSTYHELRDPKSHGYVFTDAEYRECKTSKEYASLCDPIRAAMVSGDPDKCPSKQPFGAVCRASITLNPDLCPTDDADCKKDIEHWKTYADGLQKLKQSGSPEQRALAAAALGEADACKPIAKPALDSCAAAAAATPGAEKPGGTPAPTATPGAEKAGGAPAPTPAPGAEKPGGTPAPTASH